MNRLEVIPVPRHRGIFPGEFSLRLICAGDESLGIPLQPSGIYLNIQYEEWANLTVAELVSTTEGVAEIPEPVDGVDVTYIEHNGLFYPLNRKSYSQIERGVCILAHDEGEPFCAYLHGSSASPPGALDAVDVAMHVEDLAAFVGADIANELGRHITAMLENFTPDGDDHRLYLRFRRMEDYNEMFLNLCELIAIEDGQPFDRQGKLHDLLGCWTDPDGAIGITTLLEQYANNVPCNSGETQAAHKAEAADFRDLIEAGYLAAEIESVFI